MELEDHVGDIVGKARAAKGVSVEEAAAWTSMSADDYSAWETTGHSAGAVAYGLLAERLGLDAAKLEGIARGWVPEPRDVGLWRELRVITTGSGMKVHCYLVWDEVTREAALFDTGFEADLVLRIVEEENLSLRHVFLTHGHHDHVAAVEPIRRRHPKVRLHSGSPNAPIEQRNRSNDFIHLGSLRITNRATPGHAEDGVTYIVGNWPEDAPNVAFVGDAIFAGSMGGAGSQLDLAKSMVWERILSLPKPTLLCPGHGPLTTVGEELARNPFFASG